MRTPPPHDSRLRTQAAAASNDSCDIAHGARSRLHVSRVDDIDRPRTSDSATALNRTKAWVAKAAESRVW